MGSKGRTLFAATLVLLTVSPAVAGDTAAAAVTSYDSNGTILLDGAKVFTIGVSNPPPLDGTTPWGTDALNEVASVGAKIFRVTPAEPAWTDAGVTAAETWNAAAAARGAYTWTNLRELARAQAGTDSETMLEKVVTTLKDSPGLAMWKGADEPWWNGWPSSLLQYPYDFVRSRDPNHLSVVIQAPRGAPADLQPYTSATDGHGVDVYPVGYGVADPKLHNVGKWTQTIRSITPNKVVFTTLQICFSGSDDPSGSGAYVMPTFEQERYMMYDAIINGARGLFFFGGHIPHCLSSADAGHGWNWTFWNDVLKNLILEIGPASELYPALLNPDSGPTMSTNDVTTEVASRRVGTNRIWVMAARHGTGTANVTVSGLPESITSGTVYKEGRSVSVENGALTDTFARWGVHVYRFEYDPKAPTITAGPRGAVASTTATFGFSSSEPGRFECSLDGRAFVRCSSPRTYSALADGKHRFSVRRRQSGGKGASTATTRTWIVDTSAPVPAIAPLSRFRKAVSASVRWRATDTGSGIASYDVRLRRAAWNGGFGSSVLWRRATAETSATLTGSAGFTYCFSVRARDLAGNTSRWSAEKCTAIPLDDRALVGSSKWARKTDSAYYLATYSSSAAKGAKLTRRGVRARRLALLATTCPGCGTAQVFWNGALVREVRLASTTTRTGRLVPIAAFRSVVPGTVVVKIVSSRKRVEIDGLGVSAR